MTARRLPAILALALALALPALADGASRPQAKAFASCSAVADYARKHALRIVEPRGLPVRFASPQPVEDTRSPGEPTPAAPQGDSVQEGVDYSGTNVQEAGVDEPDIVKTDGNRLYVVTGSVLYVLDVRGDTPKLLGSLPLKGYGHELLVSGDRVLALTTVYNDPVLAPEPAQTAAMIAPYRYEEPSTRLFEIDVSDPSQPKLLNTLTVEGFYVSARMRDSVARVVVSTPPSPWPVDYEQPTSDEEAVAQQREAIRKTRLSTWVPDGVFRNRVRGTRHVRRMVTCNDIRKPMVYSGPGTLSVLTVDLARGLQPLDSDSLMTDAHTIYASKRSLFVATEKWVDPTRSDPQALVDTGRFTTIHRFALVDPETAEYRASGDVRGFILNQFSLSEHHGVLRVASTDQPPWRAGADQRQSESFVTTLEEDGPALGTIGRIGGLGRGERIYAVRFLGDVGYVVTFRQVDPLYTVDLSNPRAPALRGELEIPGFSSYLHPLGGDLLLGLGQAVGSDGRPQGVQLSLFDVSDLNAPRRLHQLSLGESTYSEAEYDHHAFLYWPPTKLSVLPLTAYGQQDPFYGAVGFAIDRSKGITEVGRAVHEAGDDPYSATVRRALVVRGHVLTVSDSGVLASTLDTLAPIGFAPFQ